MKAQLITLSLIWDQINNNIPGMNNKEPLEHGASWVRSLLNTEYTYQYNQPKHYFSKSTTVAIVIHMI